MRATSDTLSIAVCLLQAIYISRDKGHTKSVSLRERVVREADAEVKPLQCWLSVLQFFPSHKMLSQSSVSEETDVLFSRKLESL